MNLNATKASEKGQPNSAPIKFTHPSGSRPLDGYTIKRGVGRGGFGEVYFGESDGGKEVALKLIRRNLEVELRGVRECLNLKHPNLVDLYDIKNDDMDDRWVVMEYVSGESLEDVIESHPDGMPIEDVLRWMYGVAAGVAYLHDHGIVHRDLKPGNILSDEGMVKIGDYGLAKFISCSRRSGQTESIGTIHYMAPEIANGRYGREIDIYALGVMLYEMLTGNVPFEGESVGEVLMKHLTAEPDLGVLNEPYRSIVERALAKDPEKRIGSVGELIEMLPGAPAGSPAQATYGATRKSTPGAANANDNANDNVVQAEQVTARREPEEEPVARAVRDAWSNVQDGWASLDLHPGVKTVLLVLAILLLMGTITIWAPPMFAALLVYGVYWLVRALVRPAIHASATPTRKRAQGAQPRPGDGGPVRAEVVQPVAKRRDRRPNHRRRQSWRDEHRARLVERSMREKLTELTGSMLLAALVAIPLSVVAQIFTTVFLEQTMQTEQTVWIALVGTLGAWIVMLPSKLWEGRRGDEGGRRFSMLVVGLAIGAVACGFAGLLMVDLPNDPDFGGEGLLSSRAFHNPDGSPTMLAYLAFFGFLFGVLRWWRMTDPLRNVRLSLWLSVWCVAWGFLLSWVWWFPQPWGLMLAGVIAVTIQLASPWVPHEERIPKAQDPDS